ncbi:MAG: transglutaminase domain-containing protein [Deltaproteobacteria bacterium]|nr:transglutaminase domain-containing protein [Deltaproteobacteria bacterium]
MRAAPLLAAATAVAVAGIVWAESGGGSASHPVLHEDLPAPGGEKAAPTIGEAGSGTNPTAIAAGDKVLPKPSVDRAPSAGTSAGSAEPVLGTGGFAADRKTTMPPDENTGADNTLHYVSVFNPDVLPFKRMSTFDGIGDDYTLKVARTVVTELPVGGKTDPRTRDRFWGDVVIQLEPGKDIALPSVAPDMRILSYEIKPKVQLKFEKDGADNFYVRTEEPGAHGNYRLVFYCDADAGYFAPNLPAHRMLVRDVVAHTPPELRPVIPTQVLKQANITLTKLGLDRDMDLGVSFNKVVGYFRAFQAGDIAHPTGDIYRDLCDSQAGVCRHRAFAFMITANALGIPTRFVENEAHAFVEVWLPDRNWQRIDLGGAALKMEVTGADNKTLHRPRTEDPFTKPPEYTKQYTQLEGDIRGLTDSQIADKRRPLDQSPSSGSVGNTPGNGSAQLAAGPDRITPDPTLPAVTQDPKKPTPHLVVTQASESAYRGDMIHVEGSARVDGKGLADHVVDIYLAPAGQGGLHPTPLGRATTGKDGLFRTDLPVPPALGLSNYEIYLSSSEDAYYNAALSD